MPDNPEDQAATARLMEQIRSQVSSPWDLLTFARARKLLESTEPPKNIPFYRSESFLKYLGAGIGTAIAVGFLLSTNVMSNARNAIALQEAEIDATRKAMATMDESIRQQEDQVSRIQAQLTEANGELEKARRLTLAERTRNAVLAQEIDEAKNTLAALKLRVSEERIIGAGLFLCEPEKVVPLYDRLSQAYQLAPVRGNVEWAAMRVYLLRDDALIYNTFVKEAGNRFSGRRSETGEWTASPESYRLELLIGDARPMPLVFDRDDLEALLINGTATYACTRTMWCFYDNRECTR